MKKTNYLSNFAAIFILVFLTGCYNIIDLPNISIPEPPPAEAGKGYVQLQFGINQRTILPTQLGFAAYKFTFKPLGNDDRTDTIFEKIETYYLLELGSWTLDVDVFNTVGATEPIATAENVPVTVAIGNTDPVVVNLTFAAFPDGSTGTLNWNISLPTGVTADQVEIILEGFDTVNQNYIITNFLTGFNSPPSVPAGYYFATVRAEIDPITPIGFDTYTGLERYIWGDVLHIYPGQTTILTHVFGDNDYFNGIENIWIFSNMTGWNVIDNNWDSKKMFRDAAGTFSWKGDVTANSYFRFALTNTSDWTPNTDENRKGGAWLVVPGASPTDEQKIPKIGENNETRFLRLHHNNNAAVEITWHLPVAGYYEITVNPVDRTFYLDRPVEFDIAITSSLPEQFSKGSSYNFTAIVTGINYTGGTFAWEVIGTESTTAFTSVDSANTTLNIASDETAEKLQVKVTYTVDDISKSAETGQIDVVDMDELEPVDGLAWDSAGIAVWAPHDEEDKVAEYEVVLLKDVTTVVWTDTVDELGKNSYEYNFLPRMRDTGGLGGVGSYTFTVRAISGDSSTISSQAVTVGTAQVVDLLDSAAGLWWEGNIARWSIVTNASSYTVQLFKDGVSGNVGTQTDIAANEFNFTNMLTTNKTGAYTFKITAVGTGLYLSSEAEVPYSKAYLNLNNGTSVIGTQTINSIAFGNDVYVAVGTHGSVMTSANGNSWTPVNTQTGDGVFASGRFAGWGTKPELHAVAFGAGKFVAVGFRGTIIYSENDGETWTLVNTTAGDPFGGWGSNWEDWSNALYSIIYTGNEFIAAGEANNVEARTVRSVDGEIWTYHANTSAGNGNAVFGLARNNNGQIIAVGNGGRVTHSTNGGVSWGWISDNLIPGTNANSIAYGSGVWVIAGNNGQIAFTDSANPTNAENWEIIPTGETRFTTGILKIIYANEQFVAIGNNGQISTSTDGERWTSIPRGTTLPGESGFTNDEGIRAIAFGGGRFVLGGNAYTGNQSKVTYSD